MTAKHKNYKNLITEVQIKDEAGFPLFSKERDRLNYMKSAYKNLPLDKAFAVYYGISSTTTEAKNNKTNYFATNFVNIEVGKIVEAQVTKFDKSGLEFFIPGVKEEIVSKENLMDIKDNIEVYLMKHQNKLAVEVREFKNGTWRVSVLNAYYKLWEKAINNAIKNEDGINVHINELTRGGYIGSAKIWTLNELTGRDYTISVFIPGSQIVLNIENEFERWLDKDVTVVPQKFGKFKKESGMPLEDSIICSRKRALQKIGIVNLHQLYQEHILRNKLATNKEEPIYDVVVTGIINSNNKTGIFVEIKDKNITGLIPTTADELLDYVPGEQIKAKIASFDVGEGKEPFLIKNNKIIKCYTRPIFEIVK